MKQRILSLDILRGLTVAGMIVVNNAGGELSYAQLRHSVWNGLTLCDFVFPFFLFMVGISIFIALNKFDFRPERSVVWKILRRTVLILLIGWALDGFHHVLKGDFFPFAHLRFMGVLPRIAICYGVVSLLSLRVKHRHFYWIIPALLAVYSLILLLGNGYACSADNVLVQVDRWLFTEAHLYTKSPVDPEGFVSTLPAIAHTMIGFLVGRWMMAPVPLRKKMSMMLDVGLILTIVGDLLTIWLPYNKRIWSPSFTLHTCGIALLMLTLITYITDERKLTRFSWMVYYGTNPLALYVGSEVVAMLFGATGLKEQLYQWITLAIPNPYLASAVYAFGFSALFGLIGYGLYRQKIFIKL